MHCSQPCSAHTSPSHKYCLALGLNEKESLSDLVLRRNSLQRTEPSHHVARAWPSYYMVGRIPDKILVHFIFLSSFCRLRAEPSGSSIQIRKRWELRTMQHPITLSAASSSTWLKAPFSHLTPKGGNQPGSWGQKLLEQTCFLKHWAFFKSKAQETCMLFKNKNDKLYDKYHGLYKMKRHLL